MNEMLTEALSRHPTTNTLLGTVSSLAAFVVPTMETVGGVLQIVSLAGGLILLTYSILAARLRYQREKALSDEAQALRRIGDAHRP